MRSISRSLAAIAAIATLVSLGSSRDVRGAGNAVLRLPHDVRPTAESVDLVLDPEAADYHGRVKIAVTLQSAVRELRFHARAMTLDSVSLRGARGAVPIAGVDRVESDQARVRLAAAPAAGLYTLTIQFHNHFNTRAISLYRVLTGGHAYLFTQFEDTEAREAFPCWDEPEFKVRWKVTLEVPAADLAVSNTPIAREIARGGTKRVEFARTPPLSSYLVAIAVGPFETVPITGLSVPGRVVTVQGAGTMAAEAVKVTPGIIRSLEGYFGRPYPFEKLDLIAAPEFLYGAMENAGAVVFADRRLLIDPHSVSPEQRQQLIGVVAHELAHMWFGDLVTMKWWDDLWLNESFASWMATKVTDEVAPEVHAGVTKMFAIHRAFGIDSRPSTNAMREKIAGPPSLQQTANDLTYNKGQAVLTMFEGWLGVAKFRAGVLAYLKAHQWANAEGHDLWLALGRVSGENVDAAMASFLEQAGVPMVSVQPLAGGRVRLSQHRFISTGEGAGDTTLWRIPVILRYPSEGAIRTRRVWLTDATITVNLETAVAPEWIEPNAGAGGYYRWSVPAAMLDGLVGAASRSLEPRERIDLIENLTAQLRGGLLHGDRYLQLMSRLADDASPEVTRAVIEGLNETRVALATPRADSAQAAFVRVTLAPALARFGMRPVADEPTGVALMRPVLLRMLADAGHDATVIAYAESLGQAYRRDPASVPASVAEPGVLIGAMRGNRQEFEDYRRHFETTTVPNERSLYLAGMGTFRDDALRRAALDYALKGPLRPQETLIIPGAMAVGNLGTEGRGPSLYPDDIEAWMMEHFAELQSKLPPNFATRIMALGGGCSEERVRAVRAFFDEPAHRVSGGDNTFSRMADVMRECAKLHDRESERAERWLLSGEWQKRPAF
jgi:cytosol alanyl aminopeptidase